MKILLRIALTLVFILALIGIFGIIAYADGRTLPVDHTVSVSGTIPAPPAKVFARIADIALIPTWRHAVKALTILPPDNGRDHWIEDLGHGQTMTFLALRTDTPTRREVLLDVPGAAYGGTWTYELSPGPTPNSTNLKITEAGFIHPPIYRFMMAHIMGPTSNLNQYMKDLQTAAPTL
jgi:uncharacterized protein YndB with AHSA1/START domain